LKAGGVGYAPLLPLGANTATVTITGDAGGKKMSLALKLQVDAKAMAIEVSDTVGVVDLSKGKWWWLGSNPVQGQDQVPRPEEDKENKADLEADLAVASALKLERLRQDLERRERRARRSGPTTRPVARRLSPEQQRLP
jgi:hypothetical protein